MKACLCHYQQQASEFIAVFYSGHSLPNDLTSIILFLATESVNIKTIPAVVSSLSNWPRLRSAAVDLRHCGGWQLSSDKRICHTRPSHKRLCQSRPTHRWVGQPRLPTTCQLWGEEGPGWTAPRRWWVWVKHFWGKKRGGGYLVYRDICDLLSWYRDICDLLSWLLWKDQSAWIQGSDKEWWKAI